MKIAYVHGFASSGSTPIVDIMRKYLPDDEVVAYDMPVMPHQAIRFLRDKVHTDDLDLIIGVSLGAYYTLHTSGCAKIAVNPPFNPNIVLDEFLGKEVEFLNPRQDGAEKFSWVDMFHDQLEYYNSEFNSPDLEILDESSLYFCDEDDVVTDNESFKDYWRKYHIPGSHRMTEDTFREYILPRVLEIKENFR